MSGEGISHEQLMRLFEAARWAPSSFNAQQWRALYAFRGTEYWETFFDLLVDANKMCAKNAAVLVVFISRKNFDYNDEPSVTHSSIYIDGSEATRERSHRETSHAGKGSLTNSEISIFENLRKE
jgi:nitroreductase